MLQLGTKLVATLTIGATLSACTTSTAITTPPQNVTYTNAVAQKNIASTDVVEIRSQRVTTVEGKTKKSEILGAVCDIKGNGYKARLVTPAKVNVPTYLGKTDPISANCTAGGERATASLEPINVTAQANAAPAPGGLVGALIVGVATAAIKAARNPANDKFDYPAALQVPFKKTAKSE